MTLMIEDYDLSPIEAEVARIISARSMRAGDLVQQRQIALFLETKLTNSQKADGLTKLAERGLIDQAPNGDIRRLWGNEFDS